MIRISPLRVLCVAVCVALLTPLNPATLGALEVRPGAPENLDRADITVSLDSEDLTGTVVLSVGETVIDARPMFPGETTTHAGVSLEDGVHRATATLRSRDSLESTSSDTFRVWSVPSPPEVLSPGRYATQSSALMIRVGASTSWIQAFLNGTRVFSGAALPGEVMNLGELNLIKGTNKLEFVVSNPLALHTYSQSVTRLEFPWSTCIVIDKSEYKLYWVKNGALVKVYPIAVGKPNTPTPVAIWRIDAKYYTDPQSVYGPRKMRLFRKTSSGYTYTAYAIHGTNEPWVIGSMASHGCIRLDNRDILTLFDQVPLGTMVQTRE